MVGVLSSFNFHKLYLLNSIYINLELLYQVGIIRESNEKGNEGSNYIEMGQTQMPTGN